MSLVDAVAWPAYNQRQQVLPTTAPEVDGIKCHRPLFLVGEKPVTVGKRIDARRLPKTGGAVMPWYKIVLSNDDVAEGLAV